MNPTGHQVSQYPKVTLKNTPKNSPPMGVTTDRQNMLIISFIVNIYGISKYRTSEAL